MKNTSWVPEKQGLIKEQRRGPAGGAGTTGGAGGFGCALRPAACPPAAPGQPDFQKFLSGHPDGRGAPQQVSASPAAKGPAPSARGPAERPADSLPCLHTPGARRPAPLPAAGTAARRGQRRARPATPKGAVGRAPPGVDKVPAGPRSSRAAAPGPPAGAHPHGPAPPAELPGQTGQPPDSPPLTPTAGSSRAAAMTSTIPRMNHSFRRRSSSPMARPAAPRRPAQHGAAPGRGAAPPPAGRTSRIR